MSKRQDYDYLIKLLLIGDSGMNTCLVLVDCVFFFFKLEKGLDCVEL